MVASLKPGGRETLRSRLQECVCVRANLWRDNPAGTWAPAHHVEDEIEV